MQELPISHFFDLAYDIDRWGPESTTEWLKLWAAREFGPELSESVAEVAHKYSRLASLKKFELIETRTFSVHNYNEAEKILDDWNALAKKAQDVHNKLDKKYHDAFFQLLLHPVLSGANFLELFIASERNAIYSGQGRNSANVWARKVLDKFDVDAQLTKRYNKIWPHMMDQTHIGYVYW